jgi:hypothetical protein
VLSVTTRALKHRRRKAQREFDNTDEDVLRRDPELYYFDSGASVSIYPEDTSLLETRSRTTLVRTAGGDVIEYKRIGLHATWGWGIVGPAPACIISLSAVRQRFHVAFDDALDAFRITERHGARSYDAWNHGGVYEINMTDAVPTVEAVLFAHRHGQLNKCSEAERAKLLHESTAHCPYPKLRAMLKAGCFSSWNVTDAALAKAGVADCHACMCGRDSIIHHVDHPVALADGIGEHFHCDIGYVFNLRYLVCVESITNYIVAVPLKDRSASEIARATVSVRNRFSNLGWAKPTKFWWDVEAGAVAAARGLLASDGIELAFGGADRHEKKAEIMTKQIHNAMRCVYLGQPYRLPYSLGGHLFEHCVDAINHLSNTTTGIGNTRWALVHRKPDTGESLNVPFGTTVYVKELKQDAGSLLAQRNRLGIVVGRDTDSSQLTVMSLDANKGLVRRGDFRMAECSLSVVRILNQWADSEAMITSMDLYDSRGADEDYLPMSPHLGQDDGFSEEEDGGSDFSSSDGEAAEPQPLPHGEPHGEPHGLASGHATAPNDEAPAPSPTRRSTRSRRAPDVLNLLAAAQPNQRPITEELIDLVLYTHDSVVPASQAEAHKARLAEALNLLAYDVFDFLPKNNNSWRGKNVVPVVVLTTAKHDAEGKFIKFKARICARGDRQVIGPDTLTSSPVVSHHTLQMLLHKAVSTKTGLTVLDVTSAYLEAKLDEEVYVRVSKQCSELLIELDPTLETYLHDDGSMMVKLKKCLYGLKQSGKVFYDLICAKLKAYGFRKSERDPALFVKGTGSTLELCTVYVDDMVLYGSNAQRAALSDYLQTCFQHVKIQDNPKSFSLLGMAFAHKEDGSLFVSLPAFEDDLVRELGIDSKDSSSTPYRSPALGDDELLNEAQIRAFRGGVAKVLYLSTHTRPELRMATAWLTTRQVAPTLGDLRDLREVGKYLVGAPHLGLRISPSNLQLSFSADASYLSHSDSRGQTGVVAWFGESNAPIHVMCSKQEINVSSSMEGEAVALAACSKLATTLLGLCEDMECPQNSPPSIQQDNQSLLTCFRNGAYNGSTRHLNMRFHMIKQQLEDGVFQLVYVPSEQVFADPLTKRVPRARFVPWRSTLLNDPTFVFFSFEDAEVCSYDDLPRPQGSKRSRRCVE